MKITFLGGVNCIGGNKFLLEDKDTRIFLDFGRNFNLGEDYFIDWLKPRGRFGLRDYFALDLIKFMPGLYNEKALEPCEEKWEEPAFDGIFLSHIHSDHTFQLEYADEKIPVYLGRTTFNILKSWEQTSKNKFGDHDYQTFHTGEKIKINDWEIEPIHVDHSVPAAYGFLIHTPEKEIAYTGDYRLHGPMKSLSEDFLEKLGENNVDILLTEGTRVAPSENRKNYSSEQVYNIALDSIKKTKDLVLASFYGRDVDRMKTFFRLAKDTGRTFVVSAVMAHLLETLHNDPNIEVPSPFTDAFVYLRKMKRYSGWEKTCLTKDNAIDYEYIHKNQNKLILALDFHHFQELIDINPGKNNLLIHSMSEAWDERDISDEIKQNWCRRFNMKYVQAHASGHCNKEEIFTNIRKIKPKTIIPIHTEYPELFKNEIQNVFMPNKKKEPETF